MSTLTAVMDLLVAGIPGGFAPKKTATEDTTSLPHDPAKVYIFHSRVTTTYTPTRFVIVTGGEGKRYGETYKGDIDQKRADIRLTITACLPEGTTGTPGPMAEWLAGQVGDVMATRRPVIPGKRVSRPRNTYTGEQAVDEGLVGLISAYYVSDYSLTVS